MPLRRIGAGIAFVFLLFVSASVSGLVVDWAWFSSIGYVSVFWTTVLARAAVFAVAFALSTLLLWANAAIALRLSSGPPASLPAAPSPGFATFQFAQGGPWAAPAPFRPSPFLARLAILAAAAILGLLIALGESSQWAMVLRFLRQTPYGLADPLFGRDIGFYFFSLPAYVAIRNWLYWLLALSALMAGAVYALHGHLRVRLPSWGVTHAAVAHASALLGLFLR